jgi:hypothetical protein
VAAGVEHLVGQHEIVAETGRRHALDFSDGGAREAMVPSGELPLGERCGLVRLHMRAESRAGKALCHYSEVAIDGAGVEDERGSGQVRRLHAGTVA